MYLIFVFLSLFSDSHFFGSVGFLDPDPRDCIFGSYLAGWKELGPGVTAALYTHNDTVKDIQIKYAVHLKNPCKFRFLRFFFFGITKLSLKIFYYTISINNNIFIYIKHQNNSCC